jgi:hypothetical protein
LLTLEVRDRIPTEFKTTKKVFTRKHRCDQCDGLGITDRKNRKLLTISTHGKNSISCVHFAGKHNMKMTGKIPQSRI